MKIQSATFISSVTDFRKCPDPVFPEYAFIGRSNVGKSSLVNMLTGIKKLAKTSQTPGKTQTINHFLINDQWYLADLPGFGYAKTSKSARERFSKMITGYLSRRKNLMNTFLLVDSRLEPQKIDTEFMEWLAVHELPFTIVFTKADKISQGKVRSGVEMYRNLLIKTWVELPAMLISSAVDQYGKEDILGIIEETNNIFNPDLLK